MSTIHRRNKHIRTTGPTRRRRRALMLSIGALAVPVIILGFSFVQHTVLRPRVDATIERTDMYVRAGEHIQVDVVNACGVPGLATRFTAFLRARNFDVPEYSSSDHREPFSRVIDRVGDSVSAQRVAYALGIDEKHIETEIDSSRFLRATVVIGMDYRSLRPMK